MKNIIQSILGAASARIVISFGKAKLIEDAQGRLQVRGGSLEDRVAMKEWLSMFAHERVPQFDNGK